MKYWECLHNGTDVDAIRTGADSLLRLAAVAGDACIEVLLLDIPSPRECWMMEAGGADKMETKDDDDD
jgi:hypothetical protein